MKKLLLPFLLLGLAGCAETQFIAQAGKMWGGDGDQPQQYKVGKPYEVGGKWYQPKEDWDYNETGMASWYGDEFHGRKTANGDVFDKNQLTAAHRTLPMPSLVRVTNLENGRSATLRVNDRGPFSRGRIIDVSHAAARVLGFEGSGTARVRVELLTEESRRLAQSLGAKLPDDALPPRRDPIIEQQSKPLQTVEMVDLDAPLPASAAPSYEPPPQPETAPMAATGNIFLQIGAFANMDNVERLKNRLKTLANVEIVPLEKNGKKLYRVRLGPLQSVTEAKSLRSQVADLGIAADAKIISD